MHPFRFGCAENEVASAKCGVAVQPQLLSGLAHRGGIEQAISIGDPQRLVAQTGQRGYLSRH